MKILGIIAEYNPFHNGHALHLRESMAQSHATHSLAIMSGPFVQRGEPALLDPYKRARMAVDSGVNLVLEMPLFAAISSAEGFAAGSIKALEALNVVDCLAFGSESHDLEQLMGISRQLASESPQFKVTLKHYLDQGHSFMKARENTLMDLGILKTSLKSNDILGLEYLKALEQLGSAMTPMTIKRHKVGYHSLALEEGLASATAIRKWHEEGRWEYIEQAMPMKAYEILRQAKHHALLSRAYPLIRYTLLTMDKSTLASLYEIREGLDNRLLKAARATADFGEFMAKVLTKRYPRTRIQRVLVYLLLQITSESVHTFDLKEPKFLRVLGADQKGLELLGLFQKKSTLPLIVKEGDFTSRDPILLYQLELGRRAQDLHSILSQEPWGRDYRNSPYIKP